MLRLKRYWFLGVVGLQLSLGVYLFDGTYAFILYLILTLWIIIRAYLPQFDGLIERQRPYSRMNALRLNGGTHTETDWYRLLRKHNYRCAKCQQVKPLTKDHIIPVSLGGTDNIKNIQPLCRSCNSIKGTKIVDYR